MHPTDSPCSVTVPRLNIILTLICRQHFADRGVFTLPAGVTPVLPILIGSPNPQCHTPEVIRLTCIPHSTVLTSCRSNRWCQSSRCT